MCGCVCMDTLLHTRYEGIYGSQWLVSGRHFSHSLFPHLTLCFRGLVTKLELTVLPRLAGCTPPPEAIHFISPILGLQMHADVSGFISVQWISTQVLVLIQ